MTVYRLPRCVYRVDPGRSLRIGPYALIPLYHTPRVIVVYLPLMHYAIWNGLRRAIIDCAIGSDYHEEVRKPLPVRGGWIESEWHVRGLIDLHLPQTLCGPCEVSGAVFVFRDGLLRRRVYVP